MLLVCGFFNLVHITREVITFLSFSECVNKHPPHISILGCGQFFIFILWLRDVAYWCSWPGPPGSGECCSRWGWVRRGEGVAKGCQADNHHVGGAGWAENQQDTCPQHEGEGSRPPPAPACRPPRHLPSHTRLWQISTFIYKGSGTFESLWVKRKEHKNK